MVKIEVERIREAKHFAEKCVSALASLEKIAAVHREAVECGTPAELDCLEPTIRDAFSRAFGALDERYSDFTRRIIDLLESVQVE